MHPQPILSPWFTHSPVPWPHGVIISYRWQESSVPQSAVYVSTVLMLCLQLCFQCCAGVLFVPLYFAVLQYKLSSVKQGNLTHNTSLASSASRQQRGELHVSNFSLSQKQKLLKDNFLKKYVFRLCFKTLWSKILVLENWSNLFCLNYELYNVSWLFCRGDILT